MSKPRHIVSEGMRLDIPYPTMGHAIEAGLIGEERRTMTPEGSRELLFKAAREIKRLEDRNAKAFLRYRRAAVKTAVAMANIGAIVGAAVAFAAASLIWNWSTVLSWLR